MDKQIKIVGHGLAGCALALAFYRKSIPFKIVGHTIAGEASMASSGLIAPITGRRYVKAWRVDEFIPEALSFYRWSEALLGQKFFSPIEIVRFLTHPESRKAWNRRLDDPAYQHYISDRQYPMLRALQKPYGIVIGGYRLDTPGWVSAVRNFLEQKGLLTTLETPFNFSPDKDHVQINATGAVDVSQTEKIIPNKGESLIVYMPEWPIEQVVKEDVFIVPLKENGFFWIGSYYMPWPDHPNPTEEGKEKLLNALTKIYKGPFVVEQHLSGVRPTVNDRRPLIGTLPGKDSMFVFNGMGTKGTSLAPFWARALVEHITSGTPLHEDVLPDRYIPRPDFGRPANL